MVGVGFTFVIPGCLPDIHWPLHIAVYTGSVNTNRVAFSHYYRFFKTRTHEKRLGDDFPEMVQKSVEVGLTETCRGCSGPKEASALLPLPSPFRCLRPEPFHSPRLPPVAGALVRA